MPELPEVETMARTLRPHVVGQRLEQAIISQFQLRQPLDGAALAAITGQRVIALERTGKYLIFLLDRGKVILSHLGMSGRYTVTSPASPIEPHTHVRLQLQSGVELRYIDPRRFGLLVVRDLGQIPELEELGPDPLTTAFTAAYAFQALRTSRRELKVLLLDQSLIAGLGNIYVNEALYLAGLRPTRRGHQLTRKQAKSLHEAIVQVLTRAVDCGGTTLSDGGYLDAEGRSGTNQQHLAVYGRGNSPCHRCSTPVRQLVQAQRSSFFCPTCQR